MNSNPDSLMVGPGVEWYRETLQKVRRRKLGKHMEEEKQTNKTQHPPGGGQRSPSDKGTNWCVKGESVVTELLWMPPDGVGEVHKGGPGLVGRVWRA